MVSDDNYCQCCGIMLGKSGKMYGTNADSSKNNEYCRYCYRNGEFLYKGTLQQMVESRIPRLRVLEPEISEEEARKILTDRLSKLDFWADKKA